MKKGMKAVIGILILACVVGATLYAMQKGSLNPVQASNSTQPTIVGSKNGIFVNTDTVKRGDIVSKVSVSGFLEEIDKENIYIEGSFKIKKILVEVNDRIKVGQQLYEVDSSDLETRLDQLELTNENNRIMLEKLQISNGAQDVGAYTNAVSSAELNLNSAETALADAKETLERNTELFQNGIISQTDFDTTEKMVRDAESAVKSAQHALNSAQGNLTEVRNNNAKISKSAQLDIASQQVNIRNTENQIADLERQIREAHENVYSGVTGLLTAVGIMENVMPTALSPAFTVIDDSNLEVKIKISQYNYGKIKVGQHVEITGDSIGEGEAFGVVESIKPFAIREMTGSATEQTFVEATVSIREKTAELIPGLSVSCEIIISESDNVLLIPLGAMDTDLDGRSFVYVIDKENDAMMMRYIEIGNYSEMDVEVLSGLEENEVYISDAPQSTFADGVKVRYFSTPLTAEAGGETA